MTCALNICPAQSGGDPDERHLGGGAGGRAGAAGYPPPGRAVQVYPIKPTLKAPVIKLLKLTCDKPLSKLAFEFNLRCYSLVHADGLMSLINAFSGGVFLTAGLTHILPHVIESAAEVDHGDYPLPYALVVIGYLLIFLVGWCRLTL